MCDMTHSDSSHPALNSEPLLYVWRGLTEWLICMGWLRLVASIKLQVSFAKYSLFYRALLAKETYNFIEPTNRSHPICMPCLTRMCDMTHSYAWQDLHSSGVCPSIKHHQFSLYTYTHTHTNKFSLTQTNTHTQTHTHTSPLALLLSPSRSSSLPPLLPAGLNLMDHDDDVAGKEAIGREVWNMKSNYAWTLEVSFECALRVQNWICRSVYEV